MKKIFTIILCMFSIISLVYLYKSTDILDFVKYTQNLEIDKNKFEDNCYYRNLTDFEKNVYANIAYMVENFETNIKMKLEISGEDIQTSVNRAIEAYRYDFPEIFYLDSIYETHTSEYGKILGITLHYTIDDKQKINMMQEDLQQEVQNIIKSNISSSMTEIEKEIAIHDYLVKNISYYNYQDVNNIPYDMHTSYNALVTKTAVCDGISKAFQIIMKKLNIYCITAFGELEGASHAWNIIKIGNEYAHVDITSDKYNVENSSKVACMHAYLNINDEKISNTHIISTKYVLPTCNSSNLEYYDNENTIYSTDNFEMKLNQIVQKNNNLDILELQVKDVGGAASKLIQYLYEMNFNNYKTKGITTLKYSLVRNIYIIPIR